MDFKERLKNALDAAAQADSDSTALVEGLLLEVDTSDVVKSLKESEIEAWEMGDLAHDKIDIYNYSIKYAVAAPKEEKVDAWKVAAVKAWEAADSFKSAANSARKVSQNWINMAERFEAVAEVYTKFAEDCCKSVLYSGGKLE